MVVQGGHVVFGAGDWTWREAVHATAARLMRGIIDGRRCTAATSVEGDEPDPRDPRGSEVKYLLTVQ